MNDGMFVRHLARGRGTYILATGVAFNNRMEWNGGIRPPWLVAGLGDKELWEFSEQSYWLVKVDELTRPYSSYTVLKEFDTKLSRERMTAILKGDW